MFTAVLSLIPRIYSVLKIIDCVDVIEHFVSENITDFWFPFLQKTLPVAFQDISARNAFLENQELVFNKSTIGLEREGTEHGHFREASAIPFKKLAELGKGGFGSVDRVLGTITHGEYARKQLPRGRTFQKDKAVLRAFEQELTRLKSLSKDQHQHIVKFVGSYTDPKFVGIVTSPVADRNLHEHLTQDLGAGARSFLRPFFGCLASALCYLHDKQIRHKDIKPQNVLVKGEHVYLTDFGLAIDRNDLSRNTTTGPTSSTPRYGAPEVADRSARSWSADIWSLGCVFLETWTVLNGESIQALHSHMTSSGALSHCYCSNLSSVESWLKFVTSRSGSAVDQVPAVWIKGMLKRDRTARWSAHAILDLIQTHNDDPTSTFSFIGHCCLHEDDTDESVMSSIAAVPEDVTIKAPTQSAFQQLPSFLACVPGSRKKCDTENAQSTKKVRPLSQDTPLSKPLVKKLHNSSQARGMEGMPDDDRQSASHNDVTSPACSEDQRTSTPQNYIVRPKIPPHPYVEDEAVSLERELGGLKGVELEETSPPSVAQYGTAETESSQGWVFYSSKQSSEHQTDSGAETDIEADAGAYASDQSRGDAAFAYNVQAHTSRPDDKHSGRQEPGAQRSWVAYEEDKDVTCFVETDASVAGSILSETHQRLQFVPMEQSDKFDQRNSNGHRAEASNKAQKEQRYQLV